MQIFSQKLVSLTTLYWWEFMNLICIKITTKYHLLPCMTLYRLKITWNSKDILEINSEDQERFQKPVKDFKNDFMNKLMEVCLVLTKVKYTLLA